MFRGVEGYGASNHIHTTRMLSLSDDLPMAIIIVDRPEAIAAFLPQLDELISEGLVVLTADGVLQARITSPRGKLAKVYWVEVEGAPTRAQQRTLESGVELRDFVTAPAKARLIAAPPGLWQRDPPIRVRKAIPTAWLELTLTDGRNRQVRRMTAAVGLPTLRLIRYAIGPWTLDGLAPGAWRSESANDRVLSSRRPR